MEIVPLYGPLIPALARGVCWEPNRHSESPTWAGRRHGSAGAAPVFAWSKLMVSARQVEDAARATRLAIEMGTFMGNPILGDQH